MELNGEARISGERPIITVSNDDGIDCAWSSEKSAVSHSIIWSRPLTAQRVEIDGAEAYAVKPYNTSRLYQSTQQQVSEHTTTSIQIKEPLRIALGLSEALFPSLPDLVLSGINVGSNCGYNMYGLLLALVKRSSMMKCGDINVNDFILVAQACLPIINGIIHAIKNKTHPKKCFLNIDLPTDIANHKGYKLTTQGKSLTKMGWIQVEKEAQGAKMLSTMSMETDSGVVSDNTTPHLLIIIHKIAICSRERTMVVEEGTDLHFLQEGFITVTPIGALSQVDVDCQNYYKEWLPKITNQP
ncbi:hypothetical protein F2Q69_00034663 [Brassica cretica]|uniref:Survival protein SurE-like phosphatase/nucleotidase domain-containing protein n=1 Tax=Brassica cretica TaxID=69181 RepID=A0A8S9SHL1_BRACR|nr:hypothetical protein F2Q69_00034663 [Brassica cretica]